MGDGGAAAGAYGFRLTGVPLGRSVEIDVPSHWPSLELATAPELAVRPATSVDADRAFLPFPAAGRGVIVERAARRAVFHGGPFAADELAHPYLSAAAAVMARWEGREVFHGGAFVGTDGTAVAVLGARNAGKSTLMAALAAAGDAVITDDLIVVDDGDVCAGPRAVDLRQAPSAALTDDGRLVASVARGGDRWRLAAPAGPSSVALGAFVFLRSRAPGATNRPVLISISARERLARIARARGYPELGGRPRTVLDLAALPAWTLEVPRAWAALAPAVELLRALPQSHVQVDP